MRLSDGAPPSMPAPMYRMEAMSAKTAGDVPFDENTLTFVAQVEVIYALK